MTEALEYYSWSGNLVMVQFLVSKGIKSWDWGYALLEASRSGQMAVIKFLTDNHSFSKNNLKDALLTAEHKWHTDVILKLNEKLREK